MKKTGAAWGKGCSQYWMTTLSGLILLGLMVTPVVAQTLVQALLPQQIQASQEGFEGVLVNSTLTESGLMFYSNFLDFWRDKPGSEKYTLEVAERKTRRFGSQVWISFGQKRIFFGNLPFKKDRIRQVSEQAAETAYATLISFTLPFKEAKDPDVAEDEI